MKLVTSEQMRRVDRMAIDDYGIPGPELMENAGRGIAEHILELIDIPDSTSFLIICGKGNNGGDGFVVARHLHKADCSVAVCFVGSVDKLSDDARLNYDRAKESGVDLYLIESVDNLPADLDCDYIIDAIFGTGFSGSPRGITAELIEYINRQPISVLAIDLPSGLNADNGQHVGVATQAVMTFTLALPKYGLFVSPGRELAGQVITVPIGIPSGVIEKFDLKTNLITSQMIADLLPTRKPEGHKGDFGKLLVLAGSTGLTGAAVLAAKSALRSGSGLVKIGCPKTVQSVIASQIIEATSYPLPDVGKKGALALRGLGEIRQLLNDHDAVAIGPGIGQHRETKLLVQKLVPSLSCPAVIDADGLNALAGKAYLLKGCTAPIVLTPHPGEFKRLSGKDVPGNIHDRIAVAREFAAEYHVVLVLKGSPTIVVDPAGNCYLNPTGNHGMATGGAGDVLTGIIGSFLGAGLSAVDAAVAAVYIHGLAGDFAADEIGARSVMAGDLIDYLPEAFAEIEE